MKGSQKIRDLVIVSGFLGSGKTTLLNRLLAHPALARTAVLINEFGDIPLDHLLVDSVEDDIIVLDNGCVCCTVRDNLVAAIIGLHERAARGLVPDFDRIILETTGLADLDALLRLLCNNRELAGIVALKGVVTALDLVSGGATVSAHREALTQLILADVIVLTKSDIAAADQRDATLGAARDWIGSTVILDGADLAALLDAMASLGQPKGLMARHEMPLAPPATPSGASSLPHGLQCQSFRAHGSISRIQFEGWLGALCAEHGGNIVRIKGLVRISDDERPLFVQTVRDTLFPTFHLDSWPDGEVGTRLVLFFSSLEIEALTASFVAATTCQWSNPIPVPEQRSFDAPYAGWAEVISQVSAWAIDLAQYIETVPPWLLHGIHNPWSRSASHVPSWQILELAKDARMMDAVHAKLGNDVILFDSELIFAQAHSLVPLNPPGSFPVEPLSGCSVIIPLTGNCRIEVEHHRTSCPASEALPLQASENATLITTDAGAAAVLALRYMPATAKFVRDERHPAHQRRRMRQLLIDSTSFPLWQISGKDHAGNDFVTGFNSVTSRWSVFPSLPRVIN